MTAEDFLRLSGPLPEPMLLVSAQGWICAANPAAAGFFKLDRRDLAGRSIFDLAAEDSQKVQRFIRSCSGSTGLTLSSIRWKNAGGQEIQARCEGALVEPRTEDRPALVLLRCRSQSIASTGFLALNEKVAALNREIAERSRVEAALRMSEQRLQSILDNSSTVIYLKGLDGRYILANRRFEQLHHISQAGLAGKTDHDLFPKHIADAFLENDRQVAAAGAPLEFEETIDLPDGKHTYFSVKFPVFDSGGRVQFLGGISADITERKRLEEQLRETQKLESLGVLAGGVAHDFNNLLTGILGNTSLALESISRDNPARAALDDVLRASERAADLTRQMLAYAGKGRFLVEKLDLSDLVREIAKLVQISIPKNVRLGLELADRLPPIDADPGQIQQIIMNLVINGAEAIPTDANGTVVVTTGEQHVDTEYLRYFGMEEVPPGKYVALEVQDTGCGMDPATQARIFDPFFSTKFAGRGLGLAATLGIVRGHKGAVKVYSTPGQGTIFKVLFPAAESTVAHPPEACGRQDLRGSGVVLVVDDEEVVRSTAKAMLERKGYSVLLARDGEEAVNIYRAASDRIDVVLLDLTMPVMGGAEAFRQLRLIQPDARVILSSGFNEAEAIRRFTSKGIAGFIQKPYTSARLAEKVKAVLDEFSGCAASPSTD